MIIKSIVKAVNKNTLRIFSTKKICDGLQKERISEENYFSEIAPQNTTQKANPMCYEILGFLNY